jgi:osmotically-inducible protein OsmY
MISKICSLAAVLILLAGVCLAADKPVNDDMLTNQVMIKLSGDAIVKGGALKVDVKDGVVTLGGGVAQENQKQRAEKLTRKVKGVKQVVNKITIETRNTGR